MNNIIPVAGNISQNPRITKDKNIIKKTHSPVSFKGGSSTLITEADKEIFNVFSKYYGNISKRLGQKVDKLLKSSKIIEKSSRFSIAKDGTFIREKQVGQALVENAAFPFVNLPLYAASWVLKKAQAIPALEAGAKKLYNKPVLRIPRKLNELDSKTDTIKGIFDKTKETIENFAKEKNIPAKNVINQILTGNNSEANEYVKESLYKVSNKFFDKNTGNFNTAFERPLNRVVSGLVPVAFLANDAYNLSVICGDKKEESRKEARERTKQEISRVFTTAYIQLLTFGAFTKQVNTIPWFTPLTSAATVLFSETTSRKRLGKPIFFLTKDKAKEYNRKNEKETENTGTTENKPPQIKNTYYTSSDNSPNIFTSFKSSAFEKKQNNKNIPKEEKDLSRKEGKTKEENRKALINLKTLEKGVVILITAGFALSFLKNSSYTKNSKPVKWIKSIGNFFKEKVYNPIAFKDFEISQDNFNNVIQSLKAADCKEVAEGHEFIKNKYGKQSADGIIKMYKSSLQSSKISEIVKSTIDILKSSGVSLEEKDCKQIEESIKTVVGLEGSSIAENKFENVAEKAAQIIKKKGFNLNSEQNNRFVTSITKSIAANVKETPLQIETKAKPFVDIITEPFKFVMSALKLPFKITGSLVKLIVSPVEKKAAKAALGEAELSKVENNIHKAVTEIFGEKQAKSGKISQTVFVNAMDQLEKKTMPYRNAKAAYEQAIQANKPKDEIKKLQNSLDKAKNKLMIYINTAIEKSFNGVTQSSNKNTDLAMMSKIASSAVTSAFLVADNYNMVMIKSNGEDKEGAKEKANERIIQRLSALFYQTMLINWFNSTFKSTYNSSLKGMTAVVIPNTLTTEILTRKSIGMPVGRKTKEQLDEIDEKNENRTGFAGKYFKFMRLLTGKKPLKANSAQKEETKSSSLNLTTAFPSLKSNNIPASTNVLEILSK